MNPRAPKTARPTEPWIWVVASIALIGGLALATCAVGASLLAPHPAAKDRAVEAGGPLAADSDRFVMVRADRTQAPADIFAAASVTAAARGLRPFARATASWCEPCRKLDASLSDPRMKDAFDGTYIVTIDIDEFDAKTLSALGMRVRAVPSFYELGADGMPTGRMLAGDWGPDVPENMAPALKRFFAASATE